MVHLGTREAERALSGILMTQGVRYWLVAAWALAVAICAGPMPALIWLAAALGGGVIRGALEAELAKSGGDIAGRLTVIATASGVVWAMAPLMAWWSGSAQGQMIAGALLFSGYTLVFTQFRAMPRRGLIVSSAYTAAAVIMAASLWGEPGYWAFLACGLLTAGTMAAGVTFDHHHRQKLIAYEAEQQRLIQELKTARDEANSASQAKSGFLAMVSHELRTPMNGVLGAAQLLDGAPLRPDEKALVGLIRNSGDALLSLLNDILDFAKIEAGRLELETIETPLRDALQRAGAIWAVNAAAKDLDYRIDIDPGVPAVVMADPTRLTQIVHNLVSNAIKFTEAGHVRLALKARRLDEARAVLEVTVSDSGPGIADDDRGRLFQAFSQLDLSTTRRFGGTGLGLAISHRLARLMGGDLTVSSRIGEGSAFVLSFEVKVCAWTVDAPQADAVADASEAAPRALSVLVAEDHPVNRQILGLWLQAKGHHPAFAENGQIALEMAQNQAFDIVLMDVNMPVMDGLTAVRRLRALAGPNQEAPVVVLSASARAEDHEAGFEAGADAYLNKPVDFNALAAVLAQAPPREAVAEAA